MHCLRSRYARWLEEEPLLTGLQIWHWFTEAPPLEPSASWWLGGGLDTLPQTVGRMNQLARRTRPPPPPQPPLPPPLPPPATGDVESYRTEWRTPNPAGLDFGSLGSMPLGNGEMAVEVFTGPFHCTR